MMNASPEMERVPLERSHAEQLPQLAPGREGLELAYAEVVSAPEKQAVVGGAQEAETAPNVTSKKFKIWICAGLSALAVGIIIVAVVTKTRGPRSKLDSNKNAASATTSGPILTTFSLPLSTTTPTVSTSSASVVHDVGTWIPTSGAYNGTGLTAVTPHYSPSPFQVVLFYQHYTGAIMSSRLPFESTWQVYDSTQDLLIPSGARNGTPLAFLDYGASADNRTTVNLV